MIQLFDFRPQRIVLVHEVLFTGFTRLPRCYFSVPRSLRVPVPRPQSSSTLAKMTSVPAAYDRENVFAKILDGRLPCHKIFETDSCIAILDAFPAVTGHALLISKAPVKTIMELSDQQAADILKELPRLCRAVQQATGSEGVNVLHNGGAAAGQVVFHLHFHVVPRVEGDKLLSQFASSKTMITDEDAGAILAKIKSHL
ncbi:hypothetical protein Esti_004576 [Eimeria stiedai]